MKKLFEQPELAVEEFEIIDILTASGGSGGGTELPEPDEWM